MDDLKIRIGGLSQLSRALRAVDAGAPKQLRLGLNDGANLLVDRTKPKIPSDSGAAKRSMVARSTRTAARVAVGGRKAPYFPWLDFGGEGRVAGRPAHRAFLAEGRYVYPTLRQHKPEIEDLLQDRLELVVRDAGLEMT